MMNTELLLKEPENVPALPGQEKLEKIIEAMKKVQQEQSEESEDIDYTEAELLDIIVRTRKATQFFMSMLPKLDKADENRLARVAESIPVINPE